MKGVLLNGNSYSEQANPNSCNAHELNMVMR